MLSFESSLAPGKPSLPPHPTGPSRPHLQREELKSHVAKLQRDTEDGGELGPVLPLFSHTQPWRSRKQGGHLSKVMERTGSDGKDSACRCGTAGFDPWVRKIPWRREWQPTPVF